MTVQWRVYQADCVIGRYYLLGSGQGPWNDPATINNSFQYSQQFAQMVDACRVAFLDNEDCWRKKVVMVYDVGRDRPSGQGW